MKKREDMINDIHRRIDEYETEKKLKRAKNTKIITSVTPVCAVAVVGLGLWKSGVLTPAHYQTISSDVNSSISAMTSTFEDTTNNSTTEKVKSTVETSTLNSQKTMTTESLTDSADDGSSNHIATVDKDESNNNSSFEMNEASDRLGDVTIDGVYYLQIFHNGEIYTIDKYLGNESDFEGYYKNCGISAEFYTTKESQDVIIVKLGNGGQVYLGKSNF